MSQLAKIIEQQKAEQADKAVNGDYPGSSLMEKEVPFPIDALPSDYTRIIQDVADIKKTEASHVGTMMLLAVSIAMGNTARVQVEDNEPVPGSIWAIMVERSGGAKGRAQRFCLKPIDKYAEEQRIRISNEKTRLYNSIQTARTQIFETQDADMKKRLENEKKGMEYKLQNMEEYYLTITDITMESVRKANMQNRRGVAYVREEINAWYNSFGKYSKGGNSSSEESFYIECFDGVPIIPFRSGSSNEPCDYPYTPVGGGTQPLLLGDLGKNNRMVSGFVFRAFFSFPDSKPLQERRRGKNKQNTIIAGHSGHYNNLIRKILEERVLKFKDEGEKIPDPDIVHFSEEALDAHEKWYNEQVRMANAMDCDNKTRDIIYSIITRSDMSLIRICLLLEMMKWTQGESSLEVITKDTVHRAARIMEYYRYTMLKVYAHVEKIRFESGQYAHRPNKINYTKVFNGRKELSRQELIDRISGQVNISQLTAEKYMLEDEKLPTRPFTTRKEGRNKFYSLNNK